MRYLVFILIGVLLLRCKTSNPNQGKLNYWSDSKIDSAKEGLPEKYRVLVLDFATLKSAVDTSHEVTIPLPEGTYVTVKVVKSSIMSEKLAAKFPEIKSYEVVEHNSISGRIDINPSGFYAMIISGNETYFVNPIEKNGSEYVSFNKKYLLPDVNNPFIDKLLNK